MRDRILHLFTDQGALVQPEAVEYIMSKREPLEYASGILDNIEECPFILTVEQLQGLEDIVSKAARASPLGEAVKSKAKPEPRVPPPEKTAQEPYNTPMGGTLGESLEESLEKSLDRFGGAKAIAEKAEVGCPPRILPKDIRIIEDITGESTCQGKIDDFKMYFNDRLKRLRKLLKKKRQMVGFIDLGRVGMADNNVKILGMVKDIRITKNGHKILTLEDERSTFSVLLHKGDGLVNDPTVLDEIIGIIGNKSRDGNLVIAQELVRPEIPVNITKTRSEEDSYVAFVSDIHMGSNAFLKEEFFEFLSWLKGNKNKKKGVAKRVKYIVVPGDTVDGIGIYPSQEEELAITDIYGQYEELARMFRDIPDHIKVIMLPGNHDAVRPAEPQPAFTDEIKRLFSENVIFVGNPCYFSLDGVVVLAYHGRSMDDFIKALPSLDYTNAIKIMEEMLKKRHMAPIYGGKTPIAPENRDYMIIDRIPDIFVTGHGHSTGMSNFRNVTLINASAWQSQTNYQKMHNFMPDPARVPLVNLKTRKTMIMNFS